MKAVDTQRARGSTKDLLVQVCQFKYNIGEKVTEVAVRRVCDRYRINNDRFANILNWGVLKNGVLVAEHAKKM